MAGPGSDWSEESLVGVEPAALDFVVARRGFGGVVRAGDHHRYCGRVVPALPGRSSGAVGQGLESRGEGLRGAWLNSGGEVHVPAVEHCQDFVSGRTIWRWGSNDSHDVVPVFRFGGSPFRLTVDDGGASGRRVGVVDRLAVSRGGRVVLETNRFGKEIVEGVAHEDRGDLFAWRLWRSRLRRWWIRPLRWLRRF